MLKLLQSIFGSVETPGRYPESLVEMAIDRTLDGTYPRLRALSEYRKRLREPVIHAIDHEIALVDSIPAPISASAGAYAEDARLGALFLSAEHMREVFVNDDELSEFRARNRLCTDGINALLLAEAKEKTILGIEQIDGLLCRDVPQSTVSFRNHRVIDPSAEEEESQRQLKCRAFDHLIGLALSRIIDAKGARGLAAPLTYSGYEDGRARRSRLRCAGGRAIVARFHERLRSRRVVPDTTYNTLSVSIHRITETYQVELAHRDPDSHGQVAPVRGPAVLDLAALLAVEALPERYGEALTRQLFADRDVAQRFAQVMATTQAVGHCLRLLVCIDPSAQELQGLRWELLRDPGSGATLATSERVLLSRYMVSRDWRPVKLRARSELTALIAVSAAARDSLRRMGLGRVDAAAEIGRAREALAGIQVRTLGGPAAPFTLDRLLDELRRGVDIVYLVSHGVFGRGTPALMLPDDAGAVAVLKGEALAVRVGELQHAPRLVVLASCESAGDGRQIAADLRTTAHASLAGRLADAGVPAVIAMQGLVSLATVGREPKRERSYPGRVGARPHHAVADPTDANRAWYACGLRSWNRTW